MRTDKAKSSLRNMLYKTTGDNTKTNDLTLSININAFILYGNAVRSYAFISSLLVAVKKSSEHMIFPNLFVVVPYHDVSSMYEDIKNTPEDTKNTFEDA